MSDIIKSITGDLRRDGPLDGHTHSGKGALGASKCWALVGFPHIEGAGREPRSGLVVERGGRPRLVDLLQSVLRLSVPVPEDSQDHSCLDSVPMPVPVVCV